MQIKKTILTISAHIFLFAAYPQNSSSETITGTAFQRNDSCLNKMVFSKLSVKKNENSGFIPALFFDTTNKDQLRLERNNFLNFNRKPLAELHGKIKIKKNFFSDQSLVLLNANLDYTGLDDNANWLNGNSYYGGDFLMNGQWMIVGIPVSVNIGNQFFADGLNYQAVNFDFRFDKDAYLDQVKKKLGDKLNPASLISNIEDPLKAIKEQAFETLKKDITDLGGNFDGLLTNEIAGIISNPSSLFSKGISELRRQYMKADFVQEVAKKEILLSALQHRKNLGEKIDAEEIKSLQSSLLRMKGLQEMLAKIERHKAKWEASGIMKKVRDFELLKKSKISGLLSNPSFIRDQAKRHLLLKGVQRIFLNVNRFNLGRDALSLSPVSFQHFLHNGISTEFLNKKGKTFMLIAGKQKEINSVFDQVFTGNLFSNNGQVRAARIGLGTKGISTSHIAVSSFEQSMSNALGIPTNANEFRKVLVTTISNQLNVGQKGIIAIDLSRSATSYRQNESITDTVLGEKSNLSRILSSKNLMDNTALSLSYGDENTEKGFSYQFNFSKVANGYNNPGNSFLTGGSVEMGSHLKKYFLKRRMQVSFRGNVREYKFNDEADSRWRNVYMVFDAKWKMKKGQYVGMRYQPNRMVRVNSDSRNVVSSIERLSFESNLYKKIGETGYRNFATLTWQKNVYTLSSSEEVFNSSLQLSSFQNVTIGKNLLFANVNYSVSDNRTQFVYFNSSLNAETGYSFQLLKRIIASSGIVYGSVHQWYQQLGIRQSLSGQLNEKFYMTVYIDARKNLKVVQTLWNSPVRADISIKYILKK